MKVRVTIRVRVKVTVRVRVRVRVMVRYVLTWSSRSQSYGSSTVGSTLQADAWRVFYLAVRWPISVHHDLPCKQKG